MTPRRKATTSHKPSGFSLMELMLVIAIMIIVAAFIAPAFTNLKSAGDVTDAAYTIKGVLEQARNYAMANNTYTWVGFFEEDGSKPSTTPTATAGNGRLVMSIVVAKDGVQGFDPNAAASSTNKLDTTRLTQVGKLIKIDNVHLPLFAIGDGTGTTFETRAALQNDPVVAYNASRFGELNSSGPNTAPYDTTNNGNTKFPFHYALGVPFSSGQYKFYKTLQFDPHGEARINSSYDIRRVVEIGLVQTHAQAVPAPVSGGGTSLAVYSGNAAAIQISGFGGNIKIYRR